MHLTGPNPSGERVLSSAQGGMAGSCAPAPAAAVWTERRPSHGWEEQEAEGCDIAHGKGQDKAT